MNRLAYYKFLDKISSSKSGRKVLGVMPIISMILLILSIIFVINNNKMNLDILTSVILIPVFIIVFLATFSYARNNISFKKILINSSFFVIYFIILCIYFNYHFFALEDFELSFNNLSVGLIITILSGLALVLFTYLCFFILTGFYITYINHRFKKEVVINGDLKLKIYCNNTNLISEIGNDETIDKIINFSINKITHTINNNLDVLYEGLINYSIYSIVNNHKGNTDFKEITYQELINLKKREDILDYMNELNFALNDSYTMSQAINEKEFRLFTTCSWSEEAIGIKIVKNDIKIVGTIDSVINNTESGPHNFINDDQKIISKILESDPDLNATYERISKLRGSND